VSESTEPRCGLSQCVDDAVGLGKPSIAHYHDSHAMRFLPRFTASGEGLVPYPNVPPVFSFGRGIITVACDGAMKELQRFSCANAA
jgi:hypothetical protein